MPYRFENCVLDVERHVLRRGGAVVEVESQVFDLLELLVRHAGVLVTKDQMIDAIWGGRIVSESAVSACIHSARVAVGDNGKAQAIFRTVTRPAGAVAKVEQAQGVKYARTADGTRVAIDRFQVVVDLEAVVAPGLVVHSDNDSVHPLAQGQLLASRIAGAEMLVVQSNNHIPMPGDPAWTEIMDATLAFVALWGVKDSNASGGGI